MAATALAPNPLPLRRRVIPGGFRLLANKAGSLVNIPATTDFADVLREWAASLKPDMLQGPAANDENAQEQVSQIEEYAEFATEIARRLAQLDKDGLSDHTKECLILVGEFTRSLSDMGVELRGVCSQSLAVKFACQSEIKLLVGSKAQKRQDSVTMFSFKNGLLANAAIAQTHVKLQRFMDLVNRHIQLANQNAELTNRQLELLDSLLGNHQLGSDGLVRQLVAQEVSAVLSKRQTDGQRCAMCIVLGSHIFF